MVEIDRTLERGPNLLDGETQPFVAIKSAQLAASRYLAGAYIVEEASEHHLARGWSFRVSRVDGSPPRTSSGRRACTACSAASSK
jgi:hypothetical protein